MISNKSPGRPMIIISIQAHHIKKASILFNEYRMFYNQPSDLEAAESFLSQRLAKKESLIFLATDETETEPMGFMQIYPSFTSVGLNAIYIVNDLYVPPQHRKKGVAHALLAKAQLSAVEARVRKIVLQTAITNTAAQTLYESCGYKKEEHFLTYNLHLMRSETES
jgi:ribosomal protein S18 acetylase RimI-like enzyme